MRICFAINNLGAGGAERVLSSLANNFVNREDFEVVAICFKRPYIYDHFYEFDKRIHLDLVESRSPDEIVNILLKTKPDVVVSFLNPMTYLMSLATQQINIPHIACERNNPYFSPLKQDRRLERDIAFELAAGCVFQTDNALSYFKDKIHGLYKIIPNAVILDCHPLKNNHVFKHKIVTVGRYVKQKNYPFVLRAFSEFKKLFPEYVLECYGKDSGDLLEIKKDAESLGISESVKFYEEQRNLHSMIKDAHFFVSGSEFEGMSNAISEAASLGLPCICTDIPGTRELIEKYEFGTLVPINDVDAMVEAMKQLINDKLYYIRLSSNGLKMYHSRNLSSVFPLWEEFILQVLGNNNPEKCL